MAALFSFLLAAVPFGLLCLAIEAVAIYLGYLDPWYDYPGKRRKYDGDNICGLWDK